MILPKIGLLEISIVLSVIFCISSRAAAGGPWKAKDDKTKCPKVKGIRNFDIGQFLGSWYVVQYYASSEEAISYRCMRAEMSIPEDRAEVTMNFTYSYTDDPLNEQLTGNITWKIPSAELPAHWVHAEQPYEGVYNTYVLDSDYKSWALLMHCAEKAKSPRYLSSFIMSRETELSNNVVTYLREKLPRYMFPMDQVNCTTLDPSEYESSFVPPTIVLAKKNYEQRGAERRRHPLKSHHSS